VSSENVKGKKVRPGKKREKGGKDQVALSPVFGAEGRRGRGGAGNLFRVMAKRKKADRKERREGEIRALVNPYRVGGGRGEREKAAVASVMLPHHPFLVLKGGQKVERGKKKKWMFLSIMWWGGEKGVPAASPVLLWHETGEEGEIKPERGKEEGKKSAA